MTCVAEDSHLVNPRMKGRRFKLVLHQKSNQESKFLRYTLRWSRLVVRVVALHLADWNERQRSKDPLETL